VLEQLDSVTTASQLTATPAAQSAAARTNSTW